MLERINIQQHSPHITEQFSLIPRLVFCTNKWPWNEVPWLWFAFWWCWLIGWISGSLIGWILLNLWQSDWSSRHYWSLIHFTTHDIILSSEPGLTQTLPGKLGGEPQKTGVSLANNGWGHTNWCMSVVHKGWWIIEYTRNDLYAKCYCVFHCNRPAKVSGFSQDPCHPHRHNIQSLWSRDARWMNKGM